MFASNELLENYFPILLFIGIAVLVSIVPLALAYFRAKRNPYAEKTSAYECGFSPISDTRHRFDIRFYLVAILFVIFDLEIAFLFPWAVAFKSMEIYGLVSMVCFLSVLTIGFVYEWKKGALDWE